MNHMHKNWTDRGRRLHGRSSSWRRRREFLAQNMSDERGQGHRHLGQWRGTPRSRDQGPGRQGDFPLRRDPALGRLLAAAGLRHRAAGRRGRPRRAGRRHGALEGRARDVRRGRRPGDPSDRQALGARAGDLDGRHDIAAHLSHPAQIAPDQYMARVGFEYPEDVSTKLADINARLEASTIPGAGVPADS
jgi:hypothetical protein